MTREDEILSASSDHRDWVCCGFIDFVADARRDSFAEGAKWADKTMIDKVCKWIEDNVENAFVRVNDTMTELNGIELSMYIHKTMEK